MWVRKNMNETKSYFAHSKFWSLAALVSLFVLVIATILAYFRLIPIEIKNIPYYDSIGHFFLFGILAFSLDRALNKRMMNVARLSLPLGAALIASYAVTDESLQFFSSVRSFDLGDLSFSLLGVVICTLLSRLAMK